MALVPHILFRCRRELEFKFPSFHSGTVNAYLANCNGDVVELIETLDVRDANHRG